MPKMLWIGLDSDKDTVRLVSLEPIRPSAPWPLDLRSFHELAEFVDYWNEHAKLATVLRVAIDNINDEDPLGVIDWLTRTGTAVQRFGLEIGDYYIYSQDAQLAKVPQSFRRAYSLALCSFYRSRADRLTRHLSHQLYRLETRLTGMRRTLEKLALAVPIDEELSASYCPF